MKVAVRPLFYKRTELESWLHAMAKDGWILKDVHLIIFQGFASFQFEQETPKHIRYALYEQQHVEDEYTWLAMGWRCLCKRGGFMVFQTMDPNLSEPIVKRAKRFYKNLLKSLLGLSFLLIFLWILRYQKEELLFASLFFSCLFLLTLPNGLGMIHDRMEMNITRIVKNMLIAIMLALLLSILLMLLIKGIRVYE